MHKIGFRKWNNKIRPGDSLESIAVKSLHQRISAVCYYLRLSVERPDENINYVHQLRTWSRRSVVALRLFRDALPHKQSTKLIKHLKKIRKTAGNARDYDVLIKKYEANNNHKDNKRILNFLQEKRRRSQKPIEKIYKKFDKGDMLSEQLDQLKQYLHSHPVPSVQGKKNGMERYAKLQLQPLVKNFFNSAPSNIYDIENLHNFRIHGKTLRYAMELTAFSFPLKFKHKIYPEIEKLQAKLGDINDSTMLTRRLQYWIMSSVRDELSSVFEQLYEQEDAKLITELDNFDSRWPLRDIKSLQMEFDEMLHDISQQEVA